MPHAVVSLQDIRESSPRRKRWTRLECQAMQDRKMLPGRYELVDGEVIDKMGQNPPHAVALLRVRNWLALVFGGLFVISQAPIDVAPDEEENNEPEPDAAVLTQPGDTYLDAHPSPADVRLVVEVSDSTLRFDRSTKAVLYAHANIPEYWVLDIAGRQIIVHRQPTDAGYADVTAYGEDEAVSPLSQPDAETLVANLLPPTRNV